MTATVPVDHKPKVGGPPAPSLSNDNGLAAVTQPVSSQAYGPRGPNAELYDEIVIELEATDNRKLDQIAQQQDGRNLIEQLTMLDSLSYQQRRAAAAAELCIGVGALDKLVKAGRAEIEDENAALPHWKVQQSLGPVNGAALLDSLRQAFRRYIVLPKGAEIALPLSTTVHPSGLAHGKGYRRADFEQAWAAYCPGENTLSHHSDNSEACKGASADELGTTRDFRNGREEATHGSKNADFVNSGLGLHGCTDQKDREGEGGAEEDIPTALRRCAHCNRPGAERWDLSGRAIWLHEGGCQRAWAEQRQ